ncbi:IclR family transcriptional regulator [Nocardia cyriacigeorgica]|uniref:IclR family transcriptional regulator n=1 Tax=Nocardia cyriacigeorgica TaxID=135487 RepID=A0A6P1DB76_9NOCA|nr:IclR family transcriptional regulator [Nocardia cyriacigeorgica]NEW40024.1 IclR family transcriptional regulator [Nocardia cyriacigeorgica]NEW46821.1 IclR family transcriptional regulator [Nocardia cyriacigeorgica]NEW53638.1 IclR family transcriptional regulator [Nocardia cyriacigeorgica]NEW58346.1 IclR family transcriptional regulator [Nocardia cyriacigeorgica]
MTIIDSGDVTRVPKRDVPPSMVERMTLILDAFDGRASRLTLEEVAGRSRLPRSTVHRILHQLVQLNWVEHAAFGYCLGGRALGLGGGDGGRDEIRAAAAPLLHELHLQTGMVVHLTVLEGGDSLYLDKVGGRFAAQFPSRVGGRGPAYATAGGKSILALLSPETVESLYRRPMRGYTDRTITSLTALHVELNRIRQRNGLAFERGESARGVACAGAAVRGPDGPVAGVSLCGDQRTTRLERVAPLVLDAAREVSLSLYPDQEARPRRGGAGTSNISSHPMPVNRLVRA